MASNKEIVIFFTFDNNYAVPAMVAINSLLRTVNKELTNRYIILIAHDNVTSKNIAALKSIVSQYDFADIVFKNTNGFLADEWAEGNFAGHNKSDTKRYQFCKETVYKCFASSLFPEYERIIYSDVDVVFKKDISDLADIDLSNNYVAGVHVMEYSGREHEAAHLGEPHFSQLRSSYIAGGIWVLNCLAIRKNRLEDKLLEVMRDSAITKKWPDQDIMNIACAGQVQHLPLRYISYADIHKIVKAIGEVTNYKQEDLWEFYYSPTILHYAAFKPWTLQSKMLMDWWSEYSLIKPYVSDFTCYKARKKKKFCFFLYRYLYKKLKFNFL